MSLYGNSLLGDFEDPYYSAQRQHMQTMDSLFRDPYGIMGLVQQQQQQPLAVALADGAAMQRDQQMRAARQQQQQQQMMPMMIPGMGMYGGMYGQHPNMMSQMMMGNMHQQMAAAQHNPNNQMYSSSSMMTYDNTGGGQPRVYQATSSTTQAGGLKETKKTVRDSETGLQKMTVGRQIGERAHTITREKNTRTGDEEENVDFVNLDEEEASEFDREWRDRSRTHVGNRSLGAHRRQHERPRAITEGRSRSPHERYSQPTEDATSSHSPGTAPASHSPDTAPAARRPIHVHQQPAAHSPQPAAAATHARPATYLQQPQRDARAHYVVYDKPPPTQH